VCDYDEVETSQRERMVLPEGFKAACQRLSFQLLNLLLVALRSINIGKTQFPLKGIVSRGTFLHFFYHLQVQHLRLL
jgi:hypothetical protein